MYMGKIDVPDSVAEQPFQARGSVLLGLMMLATALPAQCPPIEFHSTPSTFLNILFAMSVLL